MFLKSVLGLRSLKVGSYQISCRGLSYTESKVLVGGKTINYVRTGEATESNRALLLMPGALGSAWTDFRPQIEMLPALLPDRTIIAWDPPGYGRSIPSKRTFPVDFFQTDAKDAHKLMLSLGFHQYSILGWSDGGITAMILAAFYPEVVDKLVIWGSNSYLLPKEIKIYESIRDVQKWSPKMRQPMEELYGKEDFAQLWSNWIDGMIQLANATPDGDICKKDLSKIQAQTLIVHGAKDPMIASEHVPFLLKSIKQSEYFEFPDGKHNIHLRYANEFNQLVSNFILRK